MEGSALTILARLLRLKADTFVAGSAIFHARDYGDVIAQMRAVVAAVR